jgi:hypothetical protein
LSTKSEDVKTSVLCAKSTAIADRGTSQTERLSMSTEVRRRKADAFVKHATR